MSRMFCLERINLPAPSEWNAEDATQILVIGPVAVIVITNLA